MNEPKHDKEAVTIIGGDAVDVLSQTEMAKKVEAVTKSGVSLGVSPETKVIDDARADTRSSFAAKFAVIALSLGVGVSGAVGLSKYINNDNQPNKVEVPPVEKPPVVVENDIIEEMPDSPEKLLKAIRKLNIPVDKSKFVLKNRYMNGLMLFNNPTKKETEEYSWEQIESKKFEQEVVLVFKFEDPNYIKSMKFVVNQPVTYVLDDQDSTLMYVYYHCVPAKLGQKRAASVAVAQAGFKNKKFQDVYLANTDFTLSECKKDK